MRKMKYTIEVGVSEAKPYRVTVETEGQEIGTHDFAHLRAALQAVDISQRVLVPMAEAGLELGKDVTMEVIPIRHEREVTPDGEDYHRN